MSGATRARTGTGAAFDVWLLGSWHIESILEDSSESAGIAQVLSIESIEADVGLKRVQVAEAKTRMSWVNSNHF